MKKWLQKLYKSKPVVYTISILALIGGVLLLFKNNINLGGLLGSLFGQKPVNRRSEVPKHRVDDSGKLIKPGESDSKGFTQAPVAENIKNPGMFDDSNIITINDSEDGKQKIELPTGVENKDVSEVVVVKPKTVEVANKDKGVDVKDLLKKFD